MKFCKKCGGSDFYICGQCKVCRKACNAAYRELTRIKPTRIKLTEEQKKRNRKAVTLAYSLKNREKLRVASKTWNTENKEKRKIYESSSKRKAKCAAWYAANTEKVKAYKAEWKKANPEAKRIQNNNRRALKIAAGGRLSRSLSEKLFKLQKGKCACCKQPLGDNYHLDHIMPLALGGSNTDGNMQLLRQRCNNQKCAKHPVDFMQERGFLL